MSEIRTELDRIISQVEEGHSKATAKGATPQSSKTLANLLTAIDTIPKATAPSMQSKSVTPSESAQTVKPDSGYDGLSQVSVGAISKTYVGSGVTKQAAKTITPSTSSQTAVAKNVYTTGAVTVAAIPSTYVKPTATKAATTYTPSTSNQTIAAGTYCSGAQTIKGDANLVADNIKSGVSIFGVAGTMTAGEDVAAETNTYTSLLDDLEAAVDALPDAGSGGSGGTVQMCTVTIKAKFAITATGYVDYLTATGYASEALPTASNSIQIQCLANSILTLGGNGFAAFTVSDGAELIRTVGSNSAMHTCIVYVTGDSTLQYGGA